MLEISVSQSCVTTPVTARLCVCLSKRDRQTWQDEFLAQLVSPSPPLICRTRWSSISDLLLNRIFDNPVQEYLSFPYHHQSKCRQHDHHHHHQSSSSTNNQSKCHYWTAFLIIIIPSVQVSVLSSSSPIIIFHVSVLSSTNNQSKCQYWTAFLIIINNYNAI